MRKYVILVAGYENHHGGTRFGLKADQRRQYILQQNPSWTNDADVLFIRIDIREGTIDRNIYDGSRRSWVVESNHEAINRRRHYRSGDFIQQDTNVLSITDVYNYIVTIGRSEPGTLKEVTILGHGWQGGPVLANSFQRDEYASGPRSHLRDPWDKDGRAKDFISDNMNDQDWNHFKNAFAPLGYIWVYGCVFTRAYYNTLYKIMRTPEFRAKRFGTHLDSDTFRLNVSPSFVTRYYDYDRLFFPVDNNERTFTRTLSQVKEFLKRGIKNTYAARVAVDTGIECRAGYLGTYSCYERSYPGHRVRYPVMVIPRNRSIYGDNFTTTVNFYKQYLAIPEDPEQRGYARYIHTQLRPWF